MSNLDLGAYEASRAAALSGVPLTTVYDWARKGVVTPSVSGLREMLWSYGDLLTLRLVRWLRTDKQEARQTSMAEVRRALERFGDDLWHEAGGEQPTIVVGSDGRVFHREQLETADGQRVVGDLLDLFAPFDDGPDLRRPDVHLRIAPGRCAGEPHLVGTRLTTRTIAALAARGHNLAMIAKLYPDEDEVALQEALCFEETLAGAA